MAGTALDITKGGTSQKTAAGARIALGLEIGVDIQPFDPDLSAIAALSTTGIVTRTGSGTFATRTLTAPAAGFTITNPAGIAGNPTFALSNDLAALEGLSSTGLAVRAASDTWVVRALTAPAAGITIANPGGAVGNPTFALSNDLAALEGLSTNGIIVRTATDTMTTRTITGTSNEITVTNGGGVSANPVLSLPSSLTFTGKTVTGGTFTSGAFNGTVGATTPSTGAFTTLSVSGLISANGGQIAFPATQIPSADPNTLDDYEEGTFTPVITGLTTAGVGTYTRQSGSYTKIGRVVFINIQITWTAHTGTGAMIVTGLPFTSAAIEQPLSIVPENLTFTGQLAARINGNSTSVVPLSITSGAAAGTITIDTSAQLQISGMYTI